MDEKVAESVRLQAQLHEKEREFNFNIKVAFNFLNLTLQFHVHIFNISGLILRHQRKKAEKVYRDLESLRKMAGRSNSNLPGDGDSLQLR